MKKIFAIFICVFVVSYGAFAHEEEKLVLDATVTKNSIHGDVAVYNLSNGKMHTSDCEWAHKCTKNCIYLSKKEIKNMFYVPCLVCGGGVIDPMQEE